MSACIDDGLKSVDGKSWQDRCSVVFDKSAATRYTSHQLALWYNRQSVSVILVYRSTLTCLSPLMSISWLLVATALYDALTVIDVQLQTSCHKNTSTRRRRISPSAWLPVWLPLPLVVTSSICSNSVRLEVCILISAPINRLFSDHQQTTSEDNARNAETWGLFWFKQHTVVRYISTKLGGKVYILLFNSLLKSHANICTNCRNINKSGRGGGYVSCSTCTVIVLAYLTSNLTWHRLFAVS